MSTYFGDNFSEMSDNMFLDEQHILSMSDAEFFSDTPLFNFSDVHVLSTDVLPKDKIRFEAPDYVVVPLDNISVFDDDTHVGLVDSVFPPREITRRNSAPEEALSAGKKRRRRRLSSTSSQSSIIQESEQHYQVQQHIAPSSTMPLMDSHHPTPMSSSYMGAFHLPLTATKQQKRSQQFAAQTRVPPSSTTHSSSSSSTDLPTPEPRRRSRSLSSAKFTCACCRITQTPLWRDGPNQKKVCNACGIRWQKYGAHCNKCMHIPKKSDTVKGVCPRCNNSLTKVPPRRVANKTPTTPKSTSTTTSTPPSSQTATVTQSPPKAVPQTMVSLPTPSSPTNSITSVTSSLSSVSTFSTTPMPSPPSKISVPVTPLPFVFE